MPENFNETIDSNKDANHSPLGVGAYYRDPRLFMTLWGRFFTRIFVYVGYLLVVAVMLTALISDIKPFQAFGVFLAIFLADKVLHGGEADKPLSEMPRHGRVNLAGYLRPRAFKALERAFDRSQITKRSFFLETARELLDMREIVGGLNRLDVPPREFREKLEELLPQSVVPQESAAGEALRDKTEKLVVGAFGAASAAGHRFIEPTDLFVSLAGMDNSFTERLIDTFSVVADDLERAFILSSLSRSLGRRLPASLGGFVPETGRRLRRRVMNRAWTARPTPTLDKYGTDFTDLARNEEIGFLIGHDAEFGRLLVTLARPVNPNALLVGEAGIGKETLVAHLAFKLVKDDVPEALFDKRLVSLEVQSLTAGAAPDELGLRLKNVVAEIIAAGNIVLYIPDIHNLVKTSGTAYLSAADALLPVIKNNAFPVVGATYPREFKELIEPRSDFASVFEIIRVQELSEAEAERLLSYESVILEREHRITVSFGAIKSAVVLAHKYLRDKFLPASAEELLKDALVEAKRRDLKILKPDVVIAAAEAKVNVPIHEATGAEAEELLKLEDTIHERLIDQTEAVKAVSDALREYRSGLARGAGPIANFLFVGPTGVGKTELAKTLAKVQFGSEKMMVRFDMTEYQDKQSFYRFIGSPDGQVSGALTEIVRARPYALILLDEFEKAFPDILNLFLQVFDDGRLTDNMGRVVDFTNTIIIATSNAHSDIINESLAKGEKMSDIAGYLKSKLTDVFRPELLNRFSKIVVFKNLEPDDLQKIVTLNLADLVQSVKGQGITMDFDPEAVEKIVKLGYDPAFGARPLRRVIEERIKAPLAQRLLEKRINRGNRIKLVLKGDEFDFVPQ